ncbi:MAG: ketoacyl-ACP synthase III [Chrysiogenetes bacterium]|nr:ketoacyl-ACP synthase III [Chrysiogenetes bacterium]
MKHLRIIGTGSAVPAKVMRNADFEKTLDTNDEWIRARTGIEERRISADSESSATFAVDAARRAIEAAGISPGEIDAILVSTVTPDMIMPSTAAMVQHELGAANAYAFDLSAACAGFVYGAHTAWGQHLTGSADTILLIGVDTLTKYCDFTDRGTCILFGDGAGAVVLRAEEGERGIVGSKLYTDGSAWETLYVADSGSRNPSGVDENGNRTNFIHMDGREIFRRAVRGMASACTELLEESGVSQDQIRWLIPHQANKRIVSAVADQLDFPLERVFINLEKYGNTSAGSIPIALDECARQGLIDEGDYLLFAAFGAGLAWGTTLIRW